MALNNLPKVGQPVVGKDGIATQPWYAWFGRIQSALNTGTLATDAVSAAIRTIATALGSPDGTPENIPALAFLRTTTYVRAGDGISVSGSLATGGVTISTTGDSSGGFVPTLLASGSTFTVPADTQALFAHPIDVEGILVVDGFLIEVN